MKSLFFDSMTTIKIKPGSVLKKLSQRHKRREQAGLQDCDNKNFTSTKLLQFQKKQLIHVQELLGRYCKVSLVPGFNNSKNDLNLMKISLLHVLINERIIKATVIKKVNRFICLKIGDAQLLDIVSFLGGARSFDSFLKANKKSKTKSFFPYEWLNHNNQLQNRQFPPIDAF